MAHGGSWKTKRIGAGFGGFLQTPMWIFGNCPQFLPLEVSWFLALCCYMTADLFPHWVQFQFVVIEQEAGPISVVAWTVENKRAIREKTKHNACEPLQITSASSRAEQSHLWCGWGCQPRSGSAIANNTDTNYCIRPILIISVSIEPA